MAMNPNTLLAAARLAYPEINWSLNKQQEVWDVARRFKFDLTNPTDAYALQIALEKDHKWKFWSDGENFHAEREGLSSPKYSWFYRPTKTELLLKCVETLEAMK